MRLLPGLVLLTFSWPLNELADEAFGVFPVSEALLSARLIGLFGEVRSRAVGLAGAVFERVDERKASLDGGNGTARGDGVCGGLLKVEREGFDAVRFGEDGVGD